MSRCHVVRQVAQLPPRAERFLIDSALDCSKLLTDLAAARAGRTAAAAWLWVEDDAGRVLAVGRATPRDVVLSPGPAEAGRLAAQALRADGTAVAGAEGALDTVDSFAAAWVADASGRSSAAVRPTAGLGVYVAGDMRPPADVAGRMRVAVPTDAPLLDGWGRGFVLEVDGVPVDADLVGPRIAQGIVVVWEVDGAPVSMAAAVPHAGDVSRVQLVWTPPEHRGRGYASACVAALTAREQAAGRRCLLYTDLANGTTNRIYPAIGYRRTGTLRRVRFGPS